jgi:hypothetical protein
MQTIKAVPATFTVKQVVDLTSALLDMDTAPLYTDGVFQPDSTAIPQVAVNLYTNPHGHPCLAATKVQCNPESQAIETVRVTIGYSHAYIDYTSLVIDKGIPGQHKTVTLSPWQALKYNAEDMDLSLPETFADLDGWQGLWDMVVVNPAAHIFTSIADKEVERA